jgi:preprotein translocase subunit SecA
MARQQCLADDLAETLPKGQERFVDDEENVYFYHLEHFYRVARKDWERIFTHFKDQTDAEHEEVVGLGGLHIVGTERHEARRIDNQLRGRAGRQGDPGSSRFYLSLEDDLMRIFGSDRIAGLMQRLGMEEGVPIEHKMVTRAIERAQRQVEAQNFSVRKHLLEYDDVMNKQRESIYALRREILDGQITIDDDRLTSREYLMELAEELLDSTIDTYCSKQVDPQEWDLEALQRDLTRLFALDGGDYAIAGFEAGTPIDQVRDRLWERIGKRYAAKEALVDPELLRRVERDIMLQIVDVQWKDHLYSLDHLKEGIGLRGYGQRDPLVEYKKESFALFQDMKDRIDEEMVRYLWWLRPVSDDEAAPARRPARRAAQVTLSGGGGDAAAVFTQAPGTRQPERTGGDDIVKTVRRETPKVGRNDPCPCGSGKKYKKCHGAGQ